MNGSPGAQRPRRARLKVSGSRTSQRDGRISLTVTVRKGTPVAPMVRLSLRDRRSGHRVLPAFHSDNHLWTFGVTAQGYRTPRVSNR
ncbi:hypothetical protein [Streptomyces sp. NBC_00344]|uniref:hypothetical protein n=1 Tax=Streptomyces sp. NBC_00344 TaxID=2975720 RepID=UPI002E1E5767